MGKCVREIPIMDRGENLTGAVLVAHPLLRDPNFRQTVIFISRHSEDEGAMGFVLNRPVEVLLADESQFPVYHGGPVEPDTMVVASIQWRENPATVAFRSFTDMPTEDDRGWLAGMRIFAGYSGWSPGQLEKELEGQSWVVVAPNRELIEMREPGKVWHSVMRESGPVLRLLAEAPENPELN